MQVPTPVSNPVAPTTSKKELKNISNRESCPRCLGNGKVHESQEKHDVKQKCKKCIDCAVCNGSGFVVGKIACKYCAARGFIHPKYAVQAHVYTINPEKLLPANLRCLDCIDCIECKGNGVFDLADQANAVPEQSYIYQTFQNLPIISVPDPSIPPINMIHPHLLAAILPNYPVKITESKLNLINTVLLASIVPVKTLVTGRDDMPCPLCDGCGFKHIDLCQLNKSKGNVRCKTCIDCKTCKGNGIVNGLIACDFCERELCIITHPLGKGFVHRNTEREHDAPLNLRCFFCVNCPDCKGTLMLTKPKE